MNDEINQQHILTIFSLLNTSNTLLFNRNLAKNLGLYEALIYKCLIKKYTYYMQNKMLTKDNFFYSTVNDLHESTSLSRYKQDKAISNLVRAKLIDVKVAGMSAKRYFRLNLDETIILNCLSLRENNEQVCKNMTNKFARNLQICSLETSDKTNINNLTLKSKIDQSDDEIDDFVRDVKEQFKIEKLTKKHVIKFLRVANNDLRVVYEAIKKTVAAARSQVTQIHNFSAYVITTIKSIVSDKCNSDLIEYDAVQEIENERAAIKEKAKNEQEKRAQQHHGRLMNESVNEKNAMKFTKKQKK